MDRLINKLKSQPTSPIDIFNIAGKWCNLFTYEYLNNFKSADDLFEYGVTEFPYDGPLEYDKNFCIILYKSNPNFGHWTILKNYDDSIHYLDSYGKLMDEPLKYSDNDKLGQIKKTLPKLLKNSEKDIYYNHIPLQELSNEVATCGLYAALFIKYDLPVDLFTAMIKNISKMMGITNDELVVILSYCI